MDVLGFVLGFVQGVRAEGYDIQASTLSWFSSIHFVAASSGDIPSSAM